MTDTTTGRRWHVGANVPGYSPEGDITCCESAAEARDALVAELDRTRDTLVDQCDHTDIQRDDTCESCTLYAAVDNLIAELCHEPRGVDIVTPGYSVQVYDGRALPVVYWAVPWPASEFDNHAGCNPDN